MMRLEFVKPHLSIVAFPDVEVPLLTIIVGINGSGKTHLLQAIQNGSVNNSVARLTPGMNAGLVRLLSVNSTQMADVVTYTPTDMPANPAMQRFGGFEVARHTVLSPYAKQLNELTSGRISQSLGPNEDVWRLGIDEVVARAGDEAYRAEIERIFGDAEAALRQPCLPDLSPDAKRHYMQSLQFISRIAKKLRISPLIVTELQEQQLRPWDADQFQNSLPTLFGQYRDVMLRNELAQLRDQREGTRKSFAYDEFIARFGRAPWAQISETFEAFSLPYKAAAPDMNGFLPVELILEKQPGGEHVNTQNLSSGEKVLLQFAISSYNYDENSVNVTRPSVLLLDEMDASLHPEMVHRWLGVIARGLVGQQGMHCILTTHSPTTVALAPETAALYEMKDGFSGLTKISKQQALNKLTFGVPTLSIDYSGRRQVFTESDTDATIYENVYKIIKSKIKCDRELNFLSTGMRKMDGIEINTGCTLVTKLVQNLNEAGNQSVYGIIDWDLINASTNRVRVIGEKSHYAIENMLLDPLLICLLLMKGRSAPGELQDIARFAGADALSPLNLQRMGDAIQQKIVIGGSGKLVKVSYLGGAVADVFQDYLRMNGHKLEDALRKEFPCLQKWLHSGKLVTAVVKEVLTEYPGFCPLPLKSIFEDVANAEPDY